MASPVVNVKQSSRLPIESVLKDSDKIWMSQCENVKKILVSLWRRKIKRLTAQEVESCGMNFCNVCQQQLSRSRAEQKKCIQLLWEFWEICERDWAREFEEFYCTISSCRVVESQVHDGAFTRISLQAMKFAKFVKVDENSLDKASEPLSSRYLMSFNL